MSEDNYERRDDVNPCSYCKYNLYKYKCLTCKHRDKSKIRPQYPVYTEREMEE